MLFIGIALLIAIGLTFVISIDAGSLVGLTQEQTGQIIPLLLILILVAGGAFSRRIKLSQMITSILLWAGIFAIVIIGYSYRNEITSLTNRVMGEFAPQSANISNDGTSVMFTRSITGSFKLNVTVNDVKIKMVFDTGASAVVLSHDDAKSIGIDVDNLRYNIRVQTANGISQASSMSINNIRIGNIERSNIKAFIAKENALETSLLGMSFLQTLSGYSVIGDKLELMN